MKTTIVIQEGITQIVLTPETDQEKSILNMINNKGVETVMKVGNFCDCAGGWIRYYGFQYNDWDKEKIDSLMLVLKEKEIKQ